MDPNRLKGNPLVIDALEPELGSKVVQAIQDDMLRAKREADEKARRAREADEKKARREK